MPCEYLLDLTLNLTFPHIIAGLGGCRQKEKAVLLSNQKLKRKTPALLGGVSGQLIRYDASNHGMPVCEAEHLQPIGHDSSYCHRLEPLHHAWQFAIVGTLLKFLIMMKQNGFLLLGDMRAKLSHHAFPIVIQTYPN